MELGRLEELCMRLHCRLNRADMNTDVARNPALEAAIFRAEDELMLYLGLDEWDTRFDSKLLDLAALYARRENSADPDAQSISTTEGGLSQSVSYGDRSAPEEALLRSVARYRRLPRRQGAGT